MRRNSSTVQDILLIQDDPADAEAIRQALTNSNDGPFHVEWVRRCSKGVERLASAGKQEKDKSDGIAAVLVDLILPDSQGIETFDQVCRAAPEIPILVLCALQDQETGKLAVQRGAQDYLLKERLDSYLLPKALAHTVDRAASAEALFQEKERAEITLDSIGDAVICTDIWGRVTYMNSVAENMTGWSRQDAAGHPLEDVLRIIDATTRQPVESPMTLAIRLNTTASLKPNCVLIRSDGAECAIEDSAAPIHDRRGRVTGAVIVFHDVSAARAQSLKWLISPNTTASPAYPIECC
jgi:PAS domain S-box-containing protein